MAADKLTHEPRWLDLGDYGKYLAIHDAWVMLAAWLSTSEIEDGDLVLDRMHDLERDVIRPVTHPIITVHLPPLEEERRR